MPKVYVVTNMGQDGHDHQCIAVFSCPLCAKMAAYAESGEVEEFELNPTTSAKGEEWLAAGIRGCELVIAGVKQQAGRMEAEGWHLYGGEGVVEFYRNYLASLEADLALLKAGHHEP